SYIVLKMTMPSLVCENNGILQDGICICPDDWTGTTCNIQNFCPEKKPTPTSKFTFPKTVLGQFASSVERCPPETTNGTNYLTFSLDFDKDIGFVLYDNDQFFQSKSFQPSLDTKRRVISANLQENSGIDQVQFAVTPSADSTMSLNDFACVFWSYDKQDWITDGCTKTENSLGHAVCSCKKQKNANFAILMAFDINYQYSEALHWISITGCALSVVGLSVTALYQIITRKSRGGSPTLLVVNICLSMTIFYLLFIFGINNPVQHVNVAEVSGENIVPESDHHKYSDQGPCTAFTALLQYFLLATFTWNTLYGINVFLLFKNSVSGTPSWFPQVAMAVGWGLPALIVGISLGSTYRVEEPLGYRQEEFCWLASLDHKQKFSIKKPMLWGFVLPLLIMLISSTAVLIYFTNNTLLLFRSRKTPLKKKMLSSFSLAVMLGLSWVTGYILLISQEENLQLILSVVFCLLNATQGVQIFILFALRPFLNSNPAILNSLHAPEIGFHNKVFFLWKNKKPESNESYKTTDIDSP
uniref:G-protein coupled receptors family 2 profile 2 domain-containing protein n=1 Tax=Sinocyclocheilus grahami TaxID=75366 RepID=A0A672PT98_SINGR